MLMIFCAMVLYLVRMVVIGVATGTVFSRYGLFYRVGRGQVVLLGVCVSPMIASMMNYWLGLIFIGWPSWFFYAAPLTMAFVWLMQNENRVLFQSVCGECWAVLRKESVSLGKWGIIDFVIAMGFVGFLASIYYIFYGFVSGMKRFIAMPHADVVIVAIIVATAILVMGIFGVGRYCKHWRKEKKLFFKQVFIATFFSVMGFAVLTSGIYNAHTIFIEMQFASIEIKALVAKVVPIAIAIAIPITVVGAFFAGWYYEQWRKHKEFIFKQALAVALFSIVGSAVLSGGIYNSHSLIGSDLSHYELNARYFLETKNSWEIDDYADERYGSSLRDDHGPLWVTELVDPRIVADMLGVGDALRISNFNLFWMYICFIIMIFLVVYRITGNTRACIMAHLLFGLYIYDKDFLLLGSRDAFRFIGLFLLLFYAGTIIHAMAEKHTKWRHYAFMAFCCWLSMNGHEGNAFIMFGLVLFMIVLLFAKGNVKAAFLCGFSALLGTLVGMVKTILIYIETGRLASSTELPFHGTPIVELLKHINLGTKDWEMIWATYSFPEFFLIGLGIVGLIIMLVEARRRKLQKLFVWSLLVLGMLLPLSGGMDWIGYECSRWFVAQLRYRMYFLILFAITGGWLLLYTWGNNHVKVICVVLSVAIIGFWGSVECLKYIMFSKREATTRQRLVMQYTFIADKIDAVSNGDAFVHRQPLLYYLHGTPKLLFHMYSEPLIQAKTYEEVEEAIGKLNIGAIVLPANGCEDYHDYSLLPFWDYIQEEFVCFSSEDYGKYVIFFNPELMNENIFSVEVN